MRKRIPWFEIALSVVFLSAYVYAAFSDAYNLPNRWFIRDDAYYYFKVAQNISEGHGSTFDGIHPTNGYHPLWLLICIPIFALARYDLILPLRVLVLVTGLLQITTALLLYHLVKSSVSKAAGMLAAAFWVFNSYILLFLYKTGVESSIALLFIVLLLYMAARFERTWRSAAPGPWPIVWLGLIAALAIFGRLDLIFFALVMGLWIVLRQSALRFLLPLDILAILVSVLVAFLARLGFAGYYDADSAAIAMIVLGSMIKIPVFYLFGLYQRPSSWKPLQLLARLALSVLVGSIVLAGALLAATALHLLPTFSRAILLIDAGLTLVLVFLIRLVAYLFAYRRERSDAASPWDELRQYGRTWLKEGAIYYGIVGGLLGLYMLWSRLAFGTFSPVSGQIKRWWGTFMISVYGGPARTWLSFFTLDPYSDFNAWQPGTTFLRDSTNHVLYRDGTGYGNPTWQHNFAYILLGAFVAIFAILLLTRKKTNRAVIQTGMIPLFVGSWIQGLSYNATGYASAKEWYWLTEPVLLTILGVLLINVAFEFILKRWRLTRPLIWVYVAWFALTAGYAYWRDAYALNPYGGSPANAPYADVVPFLESYTPPGAIIGMTGGGNIGYFIHDRVIVNMDGLINSDQYFVALKNGTSADYLLNSGMQYVFANPDLLKANPYRGQYTDRLKGIASWGGKDLMRLLPNSPE